MGDEFNPYNDEYLDSTQLPDITEAVTPMQEVTAEDPTGISQEQDMIQAQAAEEEMLHDTPEEIEVGNMYDLIPIAIEQRRHLQITYTGQKSQMMKTYIVEPYEIGGHPAGYPGGYLWVHDTEIERTKSFFLSNINDIQLLDTTFIPRY